MLHPKVKKHYLKTISIIVLCFIMLSVVITVFAHSGDTDSSGGHYDSTTGKYHYHHGEPAHQHSNGKCPYKITQGGFSEVINKIVIFIGCAISIPLFVNMIIGGIIGSIIDYVSKLNPRKKEQLSESEQILYEEKQDKIYGFFSILLYIAELIVLAIVIIQW